MGPMNTFLPALEQQFARLHARSVALARAVPAGNLYQPPGTPAPGAPPIYSCGEHLLRSAGAVEQTFGGITANLWDDPFEWTLPEALARPESVLEYLAEVAATRRRGFTLFKHDGDLIKEIAVPSGEMSTLFALLTETLIRSALHQGRADATFLIVSVGSGITSSPNA